MLLDGYSQSARFYDLFDQKESIPFFLSYASEAEQVLDIGAGTGRISLPIAEAHVPVTAVEPSHAMIEVLRDKIDAQPMLRSWIRVVEGTAANFDTGDRYPLAILSGCFDHFLNSSERISSLTNIHRHLLPGGLLVFDVFLGLMKDCPLSPAGVVQQGSRTIKRFIERTSVSGGMARIRLVYEVYEEDRLVEQVQQLSAAGMVNRDEVEDQLKTAGFIIENTYQDYQKTAYKPGAALWVVEARV